MCETEKSCAWFLFFDGRILLSKKGGRLVIPEGEKPPFQASSVINVPFPGSDKEARAGRLDAFIEEDGSYIMMGLRSSSEAVSRSVYMQAGKAAQLLYWNEHSRYCPACAMPNEHLLPIMKKCPGCGFEQFPVIAPAIIVLIRKADEILLVRACNFKGSFHGLVAGFLEPGETLEECVAREVKEETGLTVNNIAYWGSQPWPYPNGLMVGFVADYAGGEISLQEEELESAAFYSKENLPEIPRKESLARSLIEWWLNGEKPFPQSQYGQYP